MTILRLNLKKKKRKKPRTRFLSEERDYYTPTSKALLLVLASGKPMTCLKK